MHVPPLVEAHCSPYSLAISYIYLLSCEPRRKRCSAEALCRFRPQGRTSSGAPRRPETRARRPRPGRFECALHAQPAPSRKSDVPLPPRRQDPSTPRHRRKLPEFAAHASREWRHCPTSIDCSTSALVCEADDRDPQWLSAPPAAAGAGPPARRPRRSGALESREKRREWRRRRRNAGAGRGKLELGAPRTMLRRL